MASGTLLSSGGRGEKAMGDRARHSLGAHTKLLLYMLCQCQTHKNTQRAKQFQIDAHSLRCRCRHRFPAAPPFLLGPLPPPHQYVPKALSYLDAMVLSCRSLPSFVACCRLFGKW